jgi:hypothetical protein
MSKVASFIDLCLQGAASPEQIDSYVSQWHAGKIALDIELRDFLGMSRQEYAEWLRDANALHSIIAARKLRQVGNHA